MEENNDKLTSELETFRQKWREEIQAKQENLLNVDSKSIQYNQKKKDVESSETPSSRGSINHSSSITSNDRERLTTSTFQDTVKDEKAAKLFLKGIQMEKQKHMYDAIQFYKQAIHLVPDIESRIEQFMSSSESASDDESHEECETEPSYERNLNLELMTERFKMLGVKGLCTPAYHSKQTHISALPTELLILIFRWVVSDQIDLRSLEQLSQVCKWFYACARDESVWRLACLRVFGTHCCPPKNFGGCWRRMLLEKPHLHFNGVYINKTSYVRSGEQSLDGFYRPYHLVEYYRYLRFYADGTVLVSTTADEPLTVIPNLRRKHQTATLSKGQYRMDGDTVNIMTKKIQKCQSEFRSRRARGTVPVQEQVFHMELQLQNSGKRRHNQLAWLDYHYNVYHRPSGQQYSNQIDVLNYKPFYFSRVKSFHCLSKAPL